MKLPSFAKTAVRALLHNAGGLTGVRYWKRQSFRILMYHDFPAGKAGMSEALDKQCAHIRRYYHAVTLTDIAKFLYKGTLLPPNALAVTVDDGNRDFLNGYPVFYAHQIPVTVFLVSGFLDRQFLFWWDRIVYAVGRTQQQVLQLSLLPGQPPEEWPLGTGEERDRAITQIGAVLKNLSDQDREPVIQDLLKRLDVESPGEPPPEMLPLEWPDMRHLAKNGVDFGGHTVTHPVLSRIGDAQKLLWEIEESKRRIEEELGHPIQHFCYPYGRWSDLNDAVIKNIARCGYQTAVTAEAGLNVPGADPFTLRRLSVDPTMPEHYFKELLAGLHVT
ncbi:MAG: polysaccharide deacetylase family protein [Elusimicrobiota bacterium]|jgi:peptidoglycan/xylan/chitin deacetylase (PgdA/CDA1 family)